MKTACHHLHDKAAKLHRLSSITTTGNLPKNGLYIAFEKGESSHNKDRIVHVGTHSGEGNLQKRFHEHLYTANKDRSILRTHIGRCILSQRWDPYLEIWSKNLTSKHAREKFEHLVDDKKQAAIEDEVTNYISSNLSFCVLAIEGKSQRKHTKTSLLSTLAQCSTCNPSQNWLGRHHPNHNFGKIGLWNIRGLKGAPFSVEGVDRVL